ncbi:unnamed protein product [Debaryomyces fabryi]|nr:unnamed protein product [Debaryomyces fabryi]
MTDNIKIIPVNINNIAYSVYNWLPTITNSSVIFSICVTIPYVSYVISNGIKHIANNVTTKGVIVP